MTRTEPDLVAVRDLPGTGSPEPSDESVSRTWYLLNARQAATRGRAPRRLARLLIPVTAGLVVIGVAFGAVGLNGGFGGADFATPNIALIKASHQPLPAERGTDPRLSRTTPEAKAALEAARAEVPNSREVARATNSVSEAQRTAEEKTVRAEAARHGRTVRFSLSFRPILGRTEDEAWAKAENILARVVAVRGVPALGQSEGAPANAGSRRAAQDAREVGHPIVRSAEPGETWCWCYVDEVPFEVEFE